MSDFIITAGTKYYVTYTSLITLCSIALFFMLLSWAIGGDEYKDLLLGDYVIPLLSLGIVAGLVLKAVCSRRQQADNMGSAAAIAMPCTVDDGTQGLA